MINTLGRGGAEILLREGLKTADTQQFRFSYMQVRPKPNDVAHELQELGAHVASLGCKTNVSAICLGVRRLARYIRRKRIDIVHGHLPVAGAIARLGARLAGVPCVYTEHSPVTAQHRVVAALSRSTWNWQAQAIAISDDVANSIRASYGVGVPIRLVWNGIDTAKFHPASVEKTVVQQALSIPVEAPVVGTVAAMRPEKRLDLWLAAARVIKSSVPGVVFLVVGDGRERPQLQRRASALGLGTAVRFVGRQEDVRPYLAAMDVFLISSESEGFGLAPVEAMAMEVPVVATDVAGLRSVIQDGETGLLGAFDGETPCTLARLTCDLLRDEPRRRLMGVTGRGVVENRYSIHRMQRELETVYRDVLSDRSRASL